MIFVFGLLWYLNYIFIGIFIIEVIICLFVMCLDYFKFGWNVFDFIIVVFFIVGELIVVCEFFFIINLFLFGVILILWKEVIILSIYFC